MHITPKYRLKIRRFVNLVFKFKANMNVLFAIFLSVILSIIPILVLAGSSVAPCDPNSTDEICFPNPIKANSLQEFMNNILRFVAEIGSIFVVLAIVYAGFLLVTARGNEQQLTTGKKALMWAIIGGAVVLGAWGLSTGISNTVNDIINTV